MEGRFPGLIPLAKEILCVICKYFPVFFGYRNQDDFVNDERNLMLSSLPNSLTKNVFKTLAIVPTLLALSCTTSPQGSRMPSSEDSSHLKNIVTNSTGALQISKARLLTDNEAAFDAKLAALSMARPGETVRITYYIYSDLPTPDITTSVFNEALLKAAARGVKVRLLVDFLTNYRVTDTLKFLEIQSKGAIQARFYGRPSDLILRDLYFMSLPCPESKGEVKATSCAEWKWKKYESEVAGKDKLKFVDFYSSLAAAGVYSKAGAVLKTGIAVGSQLDLKAMKESGSSSPEQNEAVKDIAKLVYEAKIKGDSLAYLKLYMAMSLYGSEVNPLLNQIYGRLPLARMERTSSSEHWEHLTDFKHQKLILVGNRYLQLGGRNIADSYHLKVNPSGKYTFMDTDIEATITSGGDKVVEAFDQLWNFTALTATLQEAEEIMPFEYVANHALLGEVTQTCLTQLHNKTLEQRASVANCLTQNLRAHPKYASFEMRMQYQGYNLQQQVAKFNTEYAPKVNPSQSFRGVSYKPMANFDDSLKETDLKNAVVAYLENVHFNPKKPSERIFGARVGRENREGKQIHSTWSASLKNVCEVSRKEGSQKRVVFHSAYWMPPANLLKALGNMMSGEWDCRNVTIQILTNSFETTDLNIINVFAKYQMKGLVEVYTQKQKAFGPAAKVKSAKLEYYEYQKPQGAAADKVHSLHTKLTLIGNDMIIGSANADVRSFYMDTNNALFIHGANEFNETYLKWIDSIISDPSVALNKTQDFLQPLKKLNAFDSMFMDALRARFKFIQKIPEAQFNSLKKVQQAIGNEMYRSTMAMLFDGGIDQVDPVKWTPGMDYDSAYDKKRKEIEKKFNRAFMLF